MEEEALLNDILDQHLHTRSVFDCTTISHAPLHPPNCTCLPGSQQQEPGRQPYLLGQDLVESVWSLDAPFEDGRRPAAEGLAAHPVAVAGQQRLLQARDAHTLRRHCADTGTPLGHTHTCTIATLHSITSSRSTFQHTLPLPCHHY